MLCREILYDLTQQIMRRLGIAVYPLRGAVDIFFASSLSS